MSGALTNYNPNDSLLSGGDSVKIMPVQGGGFIQDGIYNADASLLSGGESAKIIPVQGGGKPIDPLTTIDETNTNNNNESVDDDLNDTLNDTVNNDDVNDALNDDVNDALNDDDKQFEVPCAVPVTTKMDDLADSFEGSDNTSDSKTKEVIRLASREFYIRQAKRKSVGQKKDDDILSDWKSQQFTDDEAEFLNTLGLSPKLLYISFSCHQKDWTEELSEFLYYLSVHSCYPASSLLLKGECQRVREFLMIVESNLKAEQLRLAATKPIPVAGPIHLPDLEDDNYNEDADQETNEEKGDHVQISNRLKNLDVDKDTSEQTKTIAKKITDFFKSMKPSFLKSKKEKLYDSVLDEIFKLEKLGKLNSNQKNEKISDTNLILEFNSLENEDIDEEEMKRKFDEKMKQLKIKKFMESLPEKYRNIDLSIFIQRMVDKK